MELYGQLTSSLNDLFAEQLTDSVQWRVVPGELSRISASPSGYTWGVNAVNDVFLRKENDQWMKTARPTDGAVLDLTTDANRVYILVQEGSTPLLRSMSVSGDGSWSEPVSVPEGTKTIVATSSHLYAETSRGLFTCASPCASGSWASSDSVTATLGGSTTRHPLEGGSGGFLQGTLENNTATITGSLQSLLEGSKTSHVLTAIFPPKKSVTVTSASSRAVYGVDGSGKAHVYKHGEWIAIPGLASKTLSSVSGEVDDTALYGVETTGQVLRCKAPCQSEADVETVGTNGRAPDTTKPKQLTIDAARQRVWGLSPVGGGSNGNSIVARNETLDAFSREVGPLEAQRDLEVEWIQQQYELARSASTAGGELKSAVDRVSALKMRLPPDEDRQLMRRQIDIGTAVSQPALFVFQVACATVLFVMIVYFILSPPWSHALAFVIACIGTAISFSASRGNGKS